MAAGRQLNANEPFDIGGPAQALMGRAASFAKGATSAWPGGGGMTGMTSIPGMGGAAEGAAGGAGAEGAGKLATAALLVPKPVPPFI